MNRRVVFFGLAHSCFDCSVFDLNGFVVGWMAGEPLQKKEREVRKITSISIE
jgi:hypothetical protein